MLAAAVALACGAAGLATTAGPASAGPDAVPVTCPQKVETNGTRYSFTAISATIVDGVYDFGAPTAAECTDGVAATRTLIEAKLPAGTAKAVGDWSCSASADGGTCLRTTATRAVRITGSCDLVDDGDPDGGDGGGDGGAAPETPACVTVDAPGGSGGSGGSGGGSGSGDDGSGGGAPADGAQRTVVVDRANRLRSAPSSLTLPRGAKGTRLRWTRWGRATATGRGRVVVRAGGRTRRGSGRIVLAGRKLCDDGRRVYTRATVRLGRRSVRFARPGCVRLT